ncbi:MAG: rane protein [Paenibacillus sp.]|jgi:putative membrane protein|nr:rane protein [Paenibacillus sp.]
MVEEVDVLMANPYMETLAFFSVAILALIVFLAIFEFVTRYNDWAEIKKGNVSVAMALGGKIFGICNIFRFAILNNDTILHSLIWASFGFVLLLITYFIFEFLTPVFKIDQEIEKDNRAVGLLSMVLSVSISYVIGASVI